MPVDRLLVEGELDAIVFFALLSPPVTVTRAGPKGSLPPKTRDLRQESRVRVCYLRDRDFDYEPPADLSVPTVDREDRNTAIGLRVLGYRSCRHAIESYLLEPSLVEKAVAWRQADYEPLLRQAAERIRAYTAARWTLGLVRRELTEHELQTRPPELSNEIKLPVDQSESASLTWMHSCIGGFLAATQQACHRERVEMIFKEQTARLARLSTVQEILIWHSGKDLLAALSPALPGRYKGHPKVLCAALRDWIRAHATEALSLFPEWQARRTALGTA